MRSLQGGFFIHKAARKIWEWIFDPPYREIRWHCIFHLLSVDFSRMVQGKALKIKTTFIFELSKMFRTLQQLSKAVMYSDLCRMLTHSADVSI